MAEDDGYQPRLIDLEEEGIDPDSIEQYVPGGARRCRALNKWDDQCKNFAVKGHDPIVCTRHLPGELGTAYRSHLKTDRPATVTYIDGRLDGDPGRWAVKCGVTKSDGGECGNWAMRGLSVCGFHADVRRNPSIVELGERVMTERVQRARLRELADKYDLESPVDNPLLALQVLTAEILALKEFLREQVENLPDDAWTYKDRQLVEQVRAVVGLYERALDRSSRLLIDISRLNIDERLAQISEKQGELIVTCLERVLRQLDLGSKTPEAKSLLSAELKRLSA